MLRTPAPLIGALCGTQDPSRTASRALQVSEMSSKDQSEDEAKAKARERAKAYYYANRERCLERGRAWRAANKANVKLNNDAYREKYRERELERSREWKDQNRDIMNERRRAAYAADIETERAIARERKKANYARNPQKYRDLARAERSKPDYKARQAAASRTWAERNRDRTQMAARRWYQSHLVQARIKLAVSQASRRQRSAGWASKEEIAAIYAEAAYLTRMTGRLHVVDHIIPLKGRLVSGLHLESNLQIIDRLANAKKSNKWEPIGWERPSGEVVVTPNGMPPKQLVLF